MTGSYSKIAKALGAFSHIPPESTANKTSDLGPEPQIGSGPAVSKFSVILKPEYGFDGDDDATPWNEPESSVCDILRTADLEHVEERVLDGTDGVLWGRVRWPSGQIRSVMVRFDGIANADVYKRFGNLLSADSKQRDLINRELLAYEVAKACGVEDMVPPRVGRELNTVSLVSDAIREKIAEKLRISPNDVDDRLGLIGIVQIIPRNICNFTSYFSTMGSSNKERWSALSDTARHSLYRAIAVDFLLGTPERLLGAFSYNQTTDKVLIDDLSLSFTNPMVCAEQYIRDREEGWGRNDKKGLSKTAETIPAHMYEFQRLFADLDPKYLEELQMTTAQIVASLGDQEQGIVGMAMAEHRLPPECGSGFFARLLYLEANPTAPIDGLAKFAKNVLVPIAIGGSVNDPAISGLVDSVDSLVSVPYPDFPGFATVMSSK